MKITFVQLRPAESMTATLAATRRQEGTTVIELGDDSFIAATLEGGLLPIGNSPGMAAMVAGIGEPAEVPGWKLTLDAGQSSFESILDDVARRQPAFLRCGRRRVEELSRIVQLPAISTALSVFVDTVEAGVGAVAQGATDLLLRDWHFELIGELRERLAVHTLVERGPYPPGLPIDTLRVALPPSIFTVWLHQVDATGAIRPRGEWAPGKDQRLPVPANRLSAQWVDQAWVAGRSPAQIEGAGELLPILERSLEGEAPTKTEVELLFGARGEQVEAIAWAADELRRRRVGDTVTYVINRNINYTNQCYFRCGFCAFSKGPRSLNLREEPYLIPLEGIVGLAQEAWDRGATEVTLQGGIHPQFTGDFYASVVEGIKERLPGMHIHGFTPLEIWQGAATLGVSVREFLTRLRDAGLGSLPGTAAEVLDDDVRIHLCPDKIRSAQWAEVMVTAHELGLPATATLMFGHIDYPGAWANHFEVIRQVQRRTGGFTEFVPLPFVHMGAPIYLRGHSRPGPTWDESVLVHSVARLAFDGLIPNIQASWVKLGLDGGARLLDAGCNDLGGTLMGEIITRSAGAAHGQEVSPEEFVATIVGAGRSPAQRNTIYELIKPPMTAGADIPAGRSLASPPTLLR
ncbi:MAG: 5-amino-6-(D-ribitylamino)uracil--L-tyrosine 4-hydroxyphenyl transferase CofH [Acidimicrobiia bacterium]|nr:5-amino-6-(D-ribitylamino)uracil--L-tyrosine 4-hydroxyphenyl transferase CofH [Acidimicrobiia bacterium]